MMFIVFSKAFDTVSHEKLMTVLKNLNLDVNDIQLISKLYWNQTASVKIEGEMFRLIKIKKGVRQGK